MQTKNKPSKFKKDYKNRDSYSDDDTNRPLLTAENQTYMDNLPTSKPQSRGPFLSNNNGSPVDKQAPSTNYVNINDSNVL